MKTLSISFAALPELEYIEQGNQLPNLKEWVTKNSFNSALEMFKENFFDKKGFTENNENRNLIFWLTLGTLLIGAKKEIKGSHGSFGMEYSDMIVTTYQNNSNPNLLHFYIVK